MVGKRDMVARLVTRSNCTEVFDSAAVAAAGAAEARWCLQQRHRNIAEVYGTVCVGLLVERVEALAPPPIDPTTALTIVPEVA